MPTYRQVVRNQLIAVLLIVCAFYSQSSRAEYDNYRVSDSIEMTQIVDPPISLAFAQAVDLNVSPDGEQAAIVTRKGNLNNGMNEYELRLLETRASRAAIASGDIVPQTVAATFATALPKHAIERVLWHANSRQIFFIGRANTDVARVYEYAIDSGEWNPITPEGIDIASYDVSPAGDRIVLSAIEAPDWTERNRRGYTLRHHIQLDLISLNPPDVLKHLRHYVLHRRTGKLVPLEMPISYVPRDFSVSPSGRWAIVLGQVHSVPYSWHEYRLIAQYSPRSLPRDSELPEETIVEYDDALNRAAVWIQQFYLVDLETGAAQTVLDAPSVNNGIPLRALWSADEQSFLLPCTYLPYGDVMTKEADRRRSFQAAVEVDRKTLQPQRVFDIPEMTSRGKPSFVRRVQRVSNELLRVDLAEYWNEEVDVQHYRKMGGEWQSADSPVLDDGLRPAKISYSIVQSLQNPPEVAATDLITQKTATITDLNPEFRKRRMGAVKVFSWTDKLGRHFEGGLVLPPDYQPERRYPIVLQTYGFNKDEFLGDGPRDMATANAARPLAGKGIIVLQMPYLDDPPASSTAESKAIGELERFQIGLEAALHALDEQHIADMSKIGIVGFSREGLHVHHALTFSPFKFAAAIISDCITATPMSYVLAYGFPRPGMLEWEDEGIIGAPLWGDGAAEWFKRSPLFHLERIRTPLRLETIGIYVPPLFETFAILKRHHRPVEMIHIPGDIHNLQTPWGRYTSQQGAVDWFSFWLLNEEDPDPAKSEQFSYWRVLREQQKAADRERTRLSTRN